MPRGTSANRPRLVEVTAVPKAIRRSVYTDLVQEFVNSDMKTAKVEGVKTTTAVTVRKAIATVGAENVKVVTAQGEVYLVKE